MNYAKLNLPQPTSSRLRWLAHDDDHIHDDGHAYDDFYGTVVKTMAHNLTLRRINKGQRDENFVLDCRISQRTMDYR
jgi:hypothetical protein